MREESERLMHLMSGGLEARPPLWEVWFAMGQMLERRYGVGGTEGYIKMALDLGHAAVPIPSPNLDNMWSVKAADDFRHALRDSTR